ncbi:MAG: dephospho-CoA kinase [Peptococcaceae bacterium]|nr:dephospho-CoA kinase [Peptococcaceae bacterium]MDH7526337.1 dephospho-CoA kinase [Peptococcaceae bacterium]
MSTRLKKGEKHVLVVGLTGGIASGKSMISRCLKELGAEIIDADKLAREIVAPNTPAWQEIKEFFGEDVLDHKGCIDRKKLAEIVFNSEEARKKLNSIVHPRVIRLVEDALNELKKRKKGSPPVVVVDAPLLIEAGLTGLVDEVWVVAAPEEIQLERLMKRDKLTRRDAEKRLRSQMPLAEKLRYADRVIDNSGDADGTLEKVRSLWQELV